ncbi:AAA family ATPase [Paenibacillus aquistagni]|uniref:AAA domain-containing protein n=1 Tax=Paenibacillus aquistagni TaxID=1852522 RepID=A0A1X7M0B1_9BACL|nr:AAA family ATPase [Paenibacillus aquistagni]SMG59511.1 AAA domain-containing protein [Paenibacillus aquistagni]
MKLLFVAGQLNRIVEHYHFKSFDLYPSGPLFLSNLPAYWSEVNPNVDAVLVLDEGSMGSSSTSRQEWLTLLSQMETAIGAPQIIAITRDRDVERYLQSLMPRFKLLSVEFSNDIRVTIEFISQAVLSNVEVKSRRVQAEASAAEVKTNRLSEPEHAQEKKSSFLDRLLKKNKNVTERTATDALTKQLEKISRGMSRVVAVTGHRGSGVTSTVVNVASEASKRGLSTIIIDLDIQYRTMNMYFNSFHERTKKDDVIHASLIRTLARPQDYTTTTYQIKDNLWLTSLGYDFKDRLLVEQFYNAAKLISLLSLLRSKFNLILLDMPLDLCEPFHDILIHIDTFGLCVPNNIYAVLNTLKNMEAVLDNETIAYLNAKSRLVVTQYNDRSRFQQEQFTPEAVSRVMTSGLLDSFMYETKVAGFVPYSQEFDGQIEADMPIVHTSKEHEHAFGSILLRLMEGTS